MNWMRNEENLQIWWGHRNFACNMLFCGRGRLTRNHKPPGQGDSRLRQGASGTPRQQLRLERMVRRRPCGCDRGVFELVHRTARRRTGFERIVRSSVQFRFHGRNGQLRRRIAGRI